MGPHEASTHVSWAVFSFAVRFFYTLGPADVETYVYDHRGLKVRKSSLTDSTHSSPVRKIRPSSAHISSTGETMLSYM